MFLINLLLCFKLNLNLNNNANECFHKRWMICRGDSWPYKLCHIFDIIVIEQWGLISVPHLLWQQTSVSNCHLQGLITPITVADRLAVELSILVLKTQVCRERESNPDLPRANRTLYQLSHRSRLFVVIFQKKK